MERLDCGVLYEPDAVVHCGAKLPDDTIAVPDPIIVVEVLSPSTSASEKPTMLAMRPASSSLVLSCLKGDVVGPAR